MTGFQAVNHSEARLAAVQFCSFGNSASQFILLLVQSLEPPFFTLHPFYQILYHSLCGFVFLSLTIALLGSFSSSGTKSFQHNILFMINSRVNYWILFVSWDSFGSSKWNIFIYTLQWLIVPKDIHRLGIIGGKIQLTGLLLIHLDSLFLFNWNLCIESWSVKTKIVKLNSWR